jgi:chromosome partitioning protein
MAKVISTINLKGGVGKTQMTVALAEFLSKEHGKRVLLIDLDPQTNATVTLIAEKLWLEKHKKGETLLQIFQDQLDKTKLFDINKAIVKGVSNVGGGIPNLDLLPSSIDLIKIQDSLPLITAGRFYVRSPVMILKGSISGILDQYDFVLIDCPPNLGIITLNGIYISDYFLIPSIPDILSTYGIPQILDRIDSFNQEVGMNIEPLGIVISMYRAQSKLHDSIIENLKIQAKEGKFPRVFDTIIPLTVRTAEAADFYAPANTLRQKYGSGRVYDNYNDLTREFLKYV